GGAAAAVLSPHALDRLPARGALSSPQRALPEDRGVLVSDDRRDHDLLRPRLAAPAGAALARRRRRAASAAPAGCPLGAPVLRPRVAASVRARAAAHSAAPLALSRQRQLDGRGTSLQLAHEAAGEIGSDDHHGDRPRYGPPLADRSGCGPARSA